MYNQVEEEKVGYFRKQTQLFFNFIDRNNR